MTGGHQKTTKEYLMGGDKISILPAAISLAVSFISSISILGHPAEIYTFGGQYFLAKIGTCLGSVITCLIFVPVLYPLKTVTSNEVW